MTRKRIAIVLGGALGVMMAALALTAVLHDGGTAQAQTLPTIYWKVSMPDLGQHSPNWCWVGAAANSFWWYADNVSGQEGLLGGVGKLWKNIDAASKAPGGACGTIAPARTWLDSRDGPDGSAVAGYPTVLLKIAEKTFYDLDQDGIQDGNEDNYCWSEGVEKWDYLIGLSKYVAAYGTNLKVHDIIDPAKCFPDAWGKYGMKPTRPPQAPPLGRNSLNPCGLDGVPDAEPAFDQAPGPPTFMDYMTELSASQDVLLWMEGGGTLETAHVVTGVGYDNTAGVGAFHLGTITISDPWTHTTNPAPPPLPPLPPVASASHNDFLPGPPGSSWQGKPDHDTSGAHAVYPASTDPYNRCDVKVTAPLQIQCYDEDTGAALLWQVVDMIFVSPFVATAVGGVAELPDVASDSGSSAGSYAAVAGGLATAVVILAVGAWYARRRFSRS